MTRLLNKAQDQVDKLTDFAQNKPVDTNLKCPVNVPKVEGKIDGFLGEANLQWRHHGFLLRQNLKTPMDKMKGDNPQKVKLKVALDDALEKSTEFGTLLKKLGKDKNGAVMRAARKYDLWMGGTDPDAAGSGGAADVWAQTFAQQDANDEMMQEAMEMAEAQNKQGAAALATMKEQSDMYKSNIEDANEVGALFNEGLERLNNLSATASRDPLGLCLCGTAMVIILAAVYVTM